jgi:hypothetical protein
MAVSVSFVRNLQRLAINFVLLVGLVLAAELRAGPAFAAPNDAAALALDHDALYGDYVATKYSDAEAKIKQALTLCNKAACSSRVRAQLHRDLGIVYVAGAKGTVEAKREFAEAIRLDPNIGLIKELTTPELETVFAAAWSLDTSDLAGGSGAGGEDIVHRPPREQAVLTPLPLYARLADGVAAAKVQVRYKPSGASDWKTVDMRKLKTGYGIELSCRDVGSTSGDLKYQILALDVHGDTLATSGSRRAPHTVSIKSALSGEAPHLPGMSPPASCGGHSECPPDQPACRSSKAKGHGDSGWGAACYASSECQDRLACKEGFCKSDDGTLAEDKTPTTCKSGEDCGPGCTGGDCAGQTAQAIKKNWLSVAVQQDSLLLPSSADTCSTMDTYTCYFKGDNLYDGAPLADQGTNQVNGRPGLATTRILVGFDRLLRNNLSAGVRLGYAFRGGPPRDADSSAFLPLHLEVRAAYWIGDKALGKGLRPYLVLAGGIAQVDASVPVWVDDTRSETGWYKLKAWKRTGRSFVGGGAGAVLALNANSGLLLEAKLQEMLGTSGMAITLSGGYAFGL